MTDVCLISCREADGDTVYKIVLPETYEYVIKGGQMPTGQKKVLIDFINDNAFPKKGEWMAGTPEDWEKARQQGIQDLEDDFSNERYADQERAMRIESDIINGKQYDGAYVSLQSVLNYCKRNNLNIVKTFEGLSW